jgi:FlaA1/EpsC-like NDP-sugar epimerase
MKNRYVLLLDLPLIAIAAFGAFAARFEWDFYEFRPEFLLYVSAAVLLKPVVFFVMGLYRRYWKYASIPDLGLVIIAVSAASLVMAVTVLAATIFDAVPVGFSRVVFFTDWVLTLAVAGGLRLSIRVVHEATGHNRIRRDAPVRRVLIVGAGAAGTMVAREMRRNPQLGMEPIAFLDDATDKIGQHIGGLPVVGGTDVLPVIARKERIDNVVIAMPTVRGAAVRRIVDMCREVGIKSQTMPGVYELLDGQINVSRLRNVQIADLLRRSPINGTGGAAQFLSDRVVLVTGGGGSIGSELSRQIAMAGPSQLVLLGHGENSIFDGAARLKAAFPHIRLSTVICDIRDEQRLASAFDRFRPDIVFHAAAHKHVPLMEENPEEAVTNNILGTRNVVRHAIRVESERLVLISTDKAVAPTSIMGATKRVSEAIVRDAALKTGRAFVAVRFGNVLGSRGSVVGTFKAQIELGGPITVTHPEMTRFFMTISEAVHLVLEASGSGRGGELFVLNMGEPVKIVQLAKDLIKLSGLAEDDVPIVFTGVRPGEKLEEVLFEGDTRAVPTPNPDVLRVTGPDTLAGVDLQDTVRRLEVAARAGDSASIVSEFERLFPSFSPVRTITEPTPDLRVVH